VTWLHRTPCSIGRAALQDALLVPLVRAVCAPFQANGAFRETEALVIVANHASHLDAPAILAALPPHARHRTAIAAADDYFYRQRLLGFAVSLAIGAFPFPRQGSLGLDRAADLLARGWNVLLFPEGTRSADGALHDFRCGVGRLVARTHAPVLPVGIVGSHALWPRSQRFPRRGPVAVRFGEPWHPEPGLSAPEVANELNRRVAALIGV